MTRILSVHTGGPLSEMWISLQSKFISDNTSNYEFVVLANGTSPEPFKKFAHRVEHLPNGTYHIDGLKHLISLPWDGPILILDSDCFPISDWSILFERLNTADIVAPIRFENLELYPHPCVTLIKPGINPNIDYRRMQMLDGTATRDVGFDPTLSCNALVRTNKKNFHPLLGAVYEFFYHHGCGSRNPAMKGMRRWRGLNHTKINDEMIFMLKNNPEKYIEEITFDFRLKII